MKRKIALLVAAAALVTATAGIAVAAGGEGAPALTRATLARAEAAALEHTGSGTVTETEAGDDGAAYGVEVRLAGGSEVEVQLDEQFRVVGEETTGDGPGDDDGPAED